MKHTTKPLPTAEVVDAVNKLQNKITIEFSRLLRLVSKGRKPDYSQILEELNLLDNINTFDNKELYFLLQTYNNKK